MKKTLFALVLGAMVFAACKKHDTNNVIAPSVNSANDIKVPNEFNWESSHHVNFKVLITDIRYNATTMHAISVYDGNPYDGGKLIAKGSASVNTPYTNDLYLSNQLTEVYVIKTSPDSSSITNKVDVKSSSAEHSFGATDPQFAPPSPKRPAAKITADCSSGCTSTITANATGITVGAGDVICITGNSITVSFGAVTGGAIRVCGTNVTLANLSLTGAAALLVTSSGSCNLSTFTCNSPTASIENFGTMTGTIADGCMFGNHGTYNCPGNFSILATAGTFINDGVMNVTGNFVNSCGIIAYNNASLNITGNFTQNTGCGDFINICSIRVTGNYTQSAKVRNYNLLKVNGTTTVNAGSELSLYNGSMLKTGNLVIDGAIAKGYGSTSFIKVTSLLSLLNVGTVISSSIQLCGFLSILDLGKLIGGATSGCGLYIPVTSCNGEGNGSSSYTDTDGDGIADYLDDYPTDATKAHNNYYPSSTGTATAAFEDQWPYKADYDLNDLVIGYRYNVITNAANNVAKVAGTYTLQATGGSLGNGFGVQFPVNRANVNGATGGTLEEGQSKAVIILFSNMRNQMAQWNTVPGAATTAPRTYSISFDVTSGPNISFFGLSGYNPFIWNYGLGGGRDREIHLWGQRPTDLATTAFFGTGDDSSSVSGNRYYVSKTGLPYAIEIPAAFTYPIESKDITQAYLRFAAWAQSGGTSFADWYSNTATGYRNTANLY